MSLSELEQEYAKLSEEEQIEFSAFVFADRLSKDSSFLAKIGREHAEIESGKKWTQEAVKELHERLGEKNL